MVFIRWKPRRPLTSRALAEHLYGRIKLRKSRKSVVNKGVPWYLLPPHEHQKRLHVKKTGKQRHMIHQCGSLRDVREVHKRLVEDGHDADKLIRKLLVEKYQSFGSVEGACNIFRSLLAASPFGCNILVSAHAQNGQNREAIRAFCDMDAQGIVPDEATLSTALACCWSLRSLEQARDIIHSLASTGFAAGERFWSSLILVLAKFGRLVEARAVFDSLLVQRVLNWTAMVAAYAREGHSKEALKLLSEMDNEGVKPAKRTFVQLLLALSRSRLDPVALLRQGRAVHTRCCRLGYKGDVHVQTALVNMYSACGSILEARAAFDEIRWKNIYAGTSMMAAYVQHGNPAEALNLYRQIEAKKVKPRDGTLAAALAACAMLGDLVEGTRIHQQVVSRGERPSPALEAAVVAMYASCGKPSQALDAFNGLSSSNSMNKDAWTALLSAYAHKGHAKQVLELLRTMDQQGVRVNELDMLCLLLSFAGHRRLLGKARNHFLSIAADRWLPYTIAHYGCMLHLLAHPPSLDDAEELINNMPFQPGAALWTFFLAACTQHGDVARAQRLAGQALLQHS